MTDPLDVALHAVRTLEGAGVPCAIGGALALGVWAVPRATLDADINVFDDAPFLSPGSRGLQAHVPSAQGRGRPRSAA